MRFKRLFRFAYLALMMMCCFSANAANSIAFYYGTDFPTDELKPFDWIVVEPRNFTFSKPWEKNKIFAYVSVGEAENRQPYYKNIPKSWYIGYNEIWKADVVDQTNVAWQRFFLNRIIGELWKKGFRGFFFDTMDSYTLGAKTPEAQKAQQAGLIKLIKAVKQKYPQAKIILNRGFELLPQVHQEVTAVAAESLFQTWDEANKKFKPVPEDHREWLLNKFKEVKEKYQLPIISIDYVSPNNRPLARQTAQKIYDLGFIPYVTDGALESIGVSTIEVLPRKVLMLYDDKESEGIYWSLALRYAAMPLEYLGYIPIFKDIRQNDLPEEPMTGRYAGIISWIDSSYIATNSALQQWLIKQKNNGVPIVILSQLEATLSNAFKKAFGLKIVDTDELPRSVKITKRSTILGFESAAYPNLYDFISIKAQNAQVLLQLKDDRRNISDAVALTPWGGYALNPFIVTLLPNEEVRWVLDPFQFFTKALKLQLYPIPDTTTENGRRLLMVHIDGDASVSYAEWYKGPLSTEVLFKEVLKKYAVPTTVSTVIGEVAPNGAYPKISPKVIPWFKKIYQLPWIEAASHTFSHPFKWQEAKFVSDKFIESTPDWFLKIRNYKFNLKYEIEGSVDYIKKTLLPDDKDCKILFWSGDCNPYDAAVGMTYTTGLLNMNGGGATITNTANSITNISGLGVYKGKYLQIFAPNQNENVYTGLWTGPFYGYERVVETFKLTNAPKRFKPIDIYYHFYSATKKASLKALKYVYDWVLKQPTMSIYTSSYIKKVLDFYHIGLARNVVDKNGAYVISTQGELRQFRVPKKYGYPDIQKSKNIIGFSPYYDDYYVHMGPLPTATLVLTKRRPTTPFLVSANGRIESFEWTDDGFKFSVMAYLPLSFTVANVKSCRILSVREKLYRRAKSRYNISYYMKKRVQDVIRIDCQA
jgi:hypothetical protein